MTPGARHAAADQALEDVRGLALVPVHRFAALLDAPEPNLGDLASAARDVLLAARAIAHLSELAAEDVKP